MCDDVLSLIKGIDLSTVALASTAFLAPYVVEKWKATYRSPKLRISFKLSAPDCHITQMKGGEMDFPVYYFRFLVENTGKTQAEDCEVLLERVFKENSAGRMVEWNNFTPVNLKWSGMRDPISRTIQPDRKVYCDLGKIQHPEHNYVSRYRGITEDDKKDLKFALELPEIPYSQWDCLTPGKYKLDVSVYSKNAEKASRSFLVAWTGKWKDGESDMFNELVIN